MNDDLKKETILVNGKEISIYVDYDNKDTYISGKEITYLYNIKPNYISMLIKRINDETSHKLLLVYPAVREIITIQKEGKNETRRTIKHYNLSIVREIGYRLNISLTDKLIDSINSLLSTADNSLNKANNYEIIRFDDGEIQLDVNVSFNEETVWLSQKELSILFDTSKSTISYHINNIFDLNELDRNSVVRKIRTTGIDNKSYDTMYYNLDMTLAIGYRVNSKRGIEFRKWVSTIIKNYIIKGYSINDKRCLECHDSLINLNNRVSKLESNNVLLNDTVFGKQYMQMINGDVSESIKILERIFSMANKRIVIVDNYIDEYIVRIVEKYVVNIIIITGNSKIKDLNLKDNITIIVDGSYHSRYIFIDDKHTYISTHSLNMISKKDFEIIYLAEVNPKYILNRFNK